MMKFMPNTAGSHSPTLTRRNVIGGTLAGTILQTVPDRSWAQSDGATYAQAVTTTHSAATTAGVGILRAGGSAADASVAVAAVLSVVEPYFSHVLGGGVWALYFESASGEVTSLGGVGPVGSAFDIEDYSARIEQRGIHQANVPGAWDGWMLWLLEHGKLTLPEILQPAITLATEGVAISAEMSSYMSRFYDSMAAHPPTAKVYAPDGTFPAEGDVIQFPDLAATFTALADAYSAAEDHAAGIRAAREYVYRGPIADAFIEESDANGGYLTPEDFSTFEAEIVSSISIDYGSNMQVHQSPPNSQGITMLLALNTLRNMDHVGLSSLDADTIHSRIEATKLAFGDRNTFIGDPDFITIDLTGLLSDEHAAAQFDRIDMDRAMNWPENSPITNMEPENTTTFHVCDKWGNAAAVTTSIGLNFVVLGNTGIHVNNRMAYTSMDPESPNLAVAGKKVRHTSCPYIVLRAGRPLLIGGNTGADSQPQVQLQQMMAAIDFGLGAQEAINHPRWISSAWVPSSYPYEVRNALQLEASHPQSLVNELTRRGHAVEIGSRNLGNGGMIKLGDEGTTAEIGAEPRFSTASGEIVD